MNSVFYWIALILGTFIGWTAKSFEFVLICVLIYLIAILLELIYDTLALQSEGKK